MNSLFVCIIVLALFYAGYRLYGRFMEKLWGVDPARKTPAEEYNDGVDYVPARHWTMLFGHHFASIAGASPIIGPVLAVMVWGWLPSILWIVIGSIFMGGVHDFSALMVSLRNKGKSIANVTELVMGSRAKIIFASFLWLSLTLVIAVFAAVTAKTLINEPRIVIPTFGLVFIAILIGQMIYRWKTGQVIATVTGLALLAILFVIGQKAPVTIGVKNPLAAWIVILLAYAFIASIMPVNILLQPRDYLATFILFFGLFFGYLGLIISRPQMRAPAFIAWSDGAGGALWPMMMVTIACGAVSGFHSLIASGTTSKQLSNERDARPVGYGAMILEGVLACLAVFAVSAGLYWNKVPGSEGLVYPELMKGGDYIGTFARGFGQLVKPVFGSALGSMIAIVILNAFVMTTLDSATRINRYITEELFGGSFNIKIFRNRWVSTAFMMIFVLYLALGRWELIWPIFGASNQLVAALTLIVVTAYLYGMKKPVKYTLYPGILILVTTVFALIYKVSGFISQSNYGLAFIGVVLLLMAAFMVVEAVSNIKRLKSVKMAEGDNI